MRRLIAITGLALMTLTLTACPFPGTMSIFGVRILAQDTEAPNLVLPEHDNAQSNMIGDCDQFHDEAMAAGMSEREWSTFGPLLKRESWCCPNVRGGDITQGDGTCTVVGISTYSHRSDVGLGQINGIHYSPDHYMNHGRVPWMCSEWDICTYQQLQDPFTNLLMMHMLYIRSGFSPWS